MNPTTRLASPCTTVLQALSSTTISTTVLNPFSSLSNHGSFRLFFCQMLTLYRPHAVLNRKNRSSGPFIPVSLGQRSTLACPDSCNTTKLHFPQVPMLNTLLAPHSPRILFQQTACLNHYGYLLVVGHSSCSRFLTVGTTYCQSGMGGKQAAGLFPALPVYKRASLSL